MKIKEFKMLKDKRESELIKMLSDKKTELIKTKLSIKFGKEKNLKKAKNLKKEISQILTVLKEKKIFSKEKGKI